MKIDTRGIIIRDITALDFGLWFCVFFFSLSVLFSCPPCFAVSSQITHHSSGADFLKGKAKDIVVSSQGTIQLGLASEVLVEKFEDVWSINSIVVSGGTVFVGTSPNGGIYKYEWGRVTKIYPVELEQEEERMEEGVNEPSDGNEAGSVEMEEYLSNEHIFAMAMDVSGRLLAGISGEKGRLIRFGAEGIETIFEANDCKYIFAIAVDDAGDIYLGTGPEGRIYRFDSFGKNVEAVYDSIDKNIVSLAIGRDGYIYAGSDSRGLVYKLEPATKRATILYDSEQDEITSLLFSPNGDSVSKIMQNRANRNSGVVYAAATSAKTRTTQAKFVPPMPSAGRPEVKSQDKKTSNTSDGGLKLEIANTKKEAGEKPSQGPKPPFKRGKPSQKSHIYKITEEGFVSSIFNEAAVFFCLAAQKDKLLVGTGNKAQLFAVDSKVEEEQVIYEDEEASQITSIVASADNIYIGMANPAKLIKLGPIVAAEGSYSSDLIDAGQPAKWGKLQLEADIPPAGKVLMTCRSGNVKDVNDPTFSDWTAASVVKGPIQTGCPVGRFFQYKLLLQTSDAKQSPVVRKVAVAHTIGNLSPRVESVSVSRIDTSGKSGILKISYKAQDKNNDKLIYKIDFRKLGRKNWIEIKDRLEADNLEWDGRTVEDGRYEIRVTASDERSNTAATKLADSRISDPVVVDNTGPVITSHYVDNVPDRPVTIILTVMDELSVIGKVDYTINSNDKWIGVIPDDQVFDTTGEEFRIVIEDLQVGENVIAIRAADDVGNTSYRTLQIDRGQ
ncbi:MAG: hypothetical protein ACYSSL_04050 [Planctomycetota bacterium]|jgi:hypothetical protein